MKNNRNFILLTFGIIISYVSLHIMSLTTLPIFADEAIYIRWTQLIIDDWQQYVFFPLNDGKTPLAFWLLIPWQYLPINQLASARLFMVLIGMIQILSIGWLVRQLSGSKRSQIIGMFFTAFLPFWYFHHATFLLDGILTLWLTLFFGMSIHVMKKIDSNKVDNMQAALKSILSMRLVLPLALTSIVFGLALLTKVPAILAVPAIALSTLYKTKSVNHFLLKSLTFLVGIVGGLLLFSLLIVSPAFPQLFARGSDFLFPLQSIILDGVWKDTVASIPNYFYTFFVYLTPSVMILNLVSLFVNKHKDRSHLLFWSGVVFLLPIMLLGKVVYPRYLFPASIFFTVNAAFTLEYFIDWVSKQRASLSSTLIGISLALLLANTIATSGIFIYYFITDSNQLPFVSADREQYLTQWSSGHGIYETVGLIEEIAQTETVAVATEGSFGTLPDGLMVYLHRKNLSSIFVDGIGFPLKSISPAFLQKSSEFDRFLLVANSDRIATSELDTASMKLIAEYCRPFNASCLQVWDFTQLQPNLLKANF